MSEFKVSSRYAKSLLGLAREHQQVDSVSHDMLLVHSVCNQNRDLRLLLSNPIVKSDKKFAIITEIFSGKITDLTMKFIGIICRKGRERILFDIAQAYHTLFNDMNNIEEATVTTTFPLTEDLRARFIDIVSELTNKTVNLKENVDPSIIGGFVLTFGDKQMDDSVSRKLRDLRQDLTKISIA